MSYDEVTEAASPIESAFEDDEEYQNLRRESLKCLLLIGTLSCCIITIICLAKESLKARIAGGHGYIPTLAGSK